ncbi:MAG: ribonuclease R, partial [Novosphingobium sp.]
MPPRSKPAPGLPTRQQVLDFLAAAPGPSGKREIAKAFGLHGNDKVALKALLRDMADEGLIDGEKRAFHRMGGVPRVTVLRVVDIEDGQPVAIPDAWSPDDGAPPPRLRIVDR